ncbi:MAG: HEAT repeat domain-containing protein [Planctomycetota bacterium JB042]
MLAHFTALALAFASVPPAEEEGGAEREPPALDVLAARLESSDPAVRDDAAERLARHDDARDVWKAVEEMLRSDSADTRRATIRVVRKLRIEEADAAVARLLRKDPDAKVRRDASHALAEVAPRKAVSRLRSAALYDDEVIVRRAAIQDLGRLGSLDAARTLCDLLEEAIVDEDAYFSTLAQRSLTLATGQTFGTNLEGWRHWIESRETVPTDVFVTPDRP